MPKKPRSNEKNLALVTLNVIDRRGVVNDWRMRRRHLLVDMKSRVWLVGRMFANAYPQDVERLTVTVLDFFKFSTFFGIHLYLS